MSFGDSESLGTQPWETPFAQVVGAESLESVRRIVTEYGDKPDQGRIWQQGYAYLHEKFPKLSYINSCKLMPVAQPRVADPEPLNENVMLRGGSSPLVNDKISSVDTATSWGANELLLLAC